MAQGFTKNQPLDTDVNLGGGSPSDYISASQKAVKTYVDNQVAGVSGWPFDVVVTVSATNAEADYSDLQDALDAATTGTTILLDVGTYTGNFTCSAQVGIFGFNAESTFINGTLTLSAAGCFLQNLYIYETSTINTNVLTPNLIVAVNCTIDAEANGSKAINLTTGSGQSFFRDCKIIGVGTGADAIYVASACSNSPVIDGGTVEGRLTAITSASIVLRHPASSSLTINGASSIIGSYINSSTGNIYQFSNGDVFPYYDNYALFNRLVNYGVTPDEHWRQGADELSWTGFAAYTGTGGGIAWQSAPNTTSYSNSSYLVSHSAAAYRAFRYRAAATGAHIGIRGRVYQTYSASAGVMIDDGVNAADGFGANNYVRAYIDHPTTLNSVVSIKFAVRTGGGAETVTTLVPVVPPSQYIGLVLATTGTRWTAWGYQVRTLGEGGEQIYQNSAATLTWTPARVGIYAGSVRADAGSKAVWDWYDESTG